MQVKTGRYVERDRQPGRVRWGGRKRQIARKVERQVAMQVGRETGTQPGRKRDRYAGRKR